MRTLEGRAPLPPSADGDRTFALQLSPHRILITLLGTLFFIVSGKQVPLSTSSYRQDDRIISSRPPLREGSSSNAALPERRALLDGYVCMSGPCSLAGGTHHTCAIVSPHRGVQCWGRNHMGQLGYEDTMQRGGFASSTMPPANVNLGEEALQIAGGGHHTCVVTVDGHVRCWGAGSNGQLGQEDTSNVGHLSATMPPKNVFLGGLATQVSSLLHISVHEGI
ncbi:hypothetical protein CYMTET_36142 [Cymbomonas tetramitiformis]|uniref:Uncharacterized protein n=1 Tax=Cymbomonas tetramitiformis TaxID=36881 RepID=A0AAE0CIP4_9CHLO|nr:hypothetical protein CYMTET_36142 [Cymbomonas tetramitiformis]